MNTLDARIKEIRHRHGQATGSFRSIGAIAIAKTQHDPGRILLRDGDRVLSRAEMLDYALRLGGALNARGLTAGAVLAFQLPNWWEACVISLTAALFGFRVVPLLTMYREAELGFMLPASGVDAVFAPMQLKGVDQLALIERSGARPAHVFSVRGRSSPVEDFEQLLTHAPGAPDLPAADDIKLVLFTSGSTGRPKGVIHTHATIDNTVQMASTFWSIGSSDVMLVASPIGHIGGSLYAFEFPWITDCMAILADSWDPDQSAEMVDRHAVTFMAGATPFLSGLISAAERRGSPLPSLRRFICGGASVPPELIHKGLDSFPNAVVSRAYGSTEAPLVCPGIRTRDEARQRADTDGETNAEVVILTEDDTSVRDGAVGEIAVKGSQLFIGYLEPVDDIDAFTADGFFRMGDLGRRIDGRFVEITGRKKDIIIRKGENISPLEIENVLMRHPDVRQASVIGMPDHERGEMVVAFVIAHPSRSFDFTKMTEHLKAAGLARQKFPEALRIVDAFPMNAVGKVQKNLLREAAFQGRKA